MSAFLELSKKGLSGATAQEVMRAAMELWHKMENDGTIRKSRIVRREGQRQVWRDIEHYSLDVIFSVGYRIESQRGSLITSR
ncbi:MAG: virulence RhuM family protein [Marinobacter sp.]|nr:virulence RhuM family protein [Marinobacter sp.]